MRTAGADSSAADGPAAVRQRAATFVKEVYQRADAVLFGWRTQDIFAGYWGMMADSGNPIAAALNTRPK
jgi:hypothetical protein